MKCFCIPLTLLLQDGVKTMFGWDERRIDKPLMSLK